MWEIWASKSPNLVTLLETTKLLHDRSSSSKWFSLIRYLGYYGYRLVQTSAILLRPMFRAVCCDTFLQLFATHCISYWSQQICSSLYGP